MPHRTAFLVLATLVAVSALIVSRSWGGEGTPVSSPVPGGAAAAVRPATADHLPPAAPTGPAGAALTPVLTPAPPRHVTFAPGERFDAERGVYYVDPRTGAVEGWQAPDVLPLFAVTPPYPVTAGGRYLAYGVYKPGVHTTPDLAPNPTPNEPVYDVLYDTQTHTLRNLSASPYRRFATDASRYVVPEQDGITVVRTEDGTVERSFVLTPFGYTRESFRDGAWSPDGQALLAWFASPEPNGAPMHRVLRLDVATGTAKELATGIFAQAEWSPDGQRYFLSLHSVIQAHTAADDSLLWRITADRLGVPVAVKDGREPLGIVAFHSVSPDGSGAAIVAWGAGNWHFATPDARLYVVDPDNGTVRFWVEGVLACGRVWTADGRWLHVVGRRGEEAGSFFVAADGSVVRYFGRYITDVSPVEPRTGGVLAYGAGASSLHVVDLPSGATRHAVTMAGEPGWDTNHEPVWLADGRMVVFAPHYGHGGCGFEHELPPDLAVHFPK